MTAERKPPHCALLLELLSDGGWHTHLEIYALQIIGHSRIAELCDTTKYGYSIERKRRTIGSGETEYLYRLVGVPVEPAPPYVRILEGRLSETARRRLDSLFRLPSSLADPVPHRDPQKAALMAGEEAGPFADGGRRDAQAGPAKQGPDVQLGLDEIVGIEGELSAMRSLGDLTAEEIDRLEDLEGRHAVLDRGIRS